MYVCVCICICMCIYVTINFIAVNNITWSKIILKAQPIFSMSVYLTKYNSIIEEEDLYKLYLLANIIYTC